MEQAFNLLRDYARTSNRRLSDLAQAFVSGTDALTGLTRPPKAGPPRQPPRPTA